LTICFDSFSTHYGKSVDVWSLGVISYILMCGFPPFFSSEKLKEIDYLSCAPFWFFFNSDTDELRNEIRDGKINFPSPFWDKITDAAKSFVRALLTVSEEQRLTAAEALEHEWIVSEIADTKNDDESTTHLLVDPFRDSPELFESLDGLPEIVSTRMQELRTLLEQRLARRPSLQHLRQSGIFRSSEHL
jgi:serine/threonine protein kinase